MTYDQLKKDKIYILLDCISGSKAYGLSLPSSDTDKKGVFITPKNEFYGFNFSDQLANQTNDEVYFEIKRFLELLTKNNPNILELLNTPEDCILFKNPILDLIKPEDFLSRLCFDTFAGYAQTQIRKAKGLNKKINKPIDSERRSVLDFCHVIYNNGSIPLTDWLKENKLSEKNCGLVSVPHFRNGYLLYSQDQIDNTIWLKGIVSGIDADDVQLSSVPRGVEPKAVMNFNKDGYSVYCKEYKEYKEWESNRNETRYQNTLSHGKNYDAKNMMHTFRLLNMAEEIALYKKVIVQRPDREFLLDIRSGKFEFEELIGMVDEKMDRLKTLYDASDLQDAPDTKKAEEILIVIRENFYK